MKNLFKLPILLLLFTSLDSLATNPAREWAKYTGTSSNDFIRSSVTDANGNLFITGYTEGGGIATANAHQSTFAGFRDAYLSKYDPQGNLIWSTYVGGSSEDRGTSIAILPATQQILLSGYTNSTNNIATPGAHKTTYGGATDGFLNCFNPDGSRAWGTYFGGTSEDMPFAVVTNDSNEIFLTGYTSSPTHISFGNGFDMSYNDGTDGFLAKFDTTGQLVWSTYLGGSQTEHLYAAVTADSMIWVGGKSSSIELGTPGVHQANKSGGTDGILYAFTRSGNLVWASYYGGNQTDIIWGLGYSADVGTMFASGRIFISGQTSSTAGIATSGAQQPNYGGGSSDAMVACFTRFGSLNWGSYIGGSGSEMSYGMAFNSHTDLLVTGGTSSVQNMSSLNSFQPNYLGGDEAFLARYNSFGQRIWATYFGNSGDEWGYNVSANQEGHIFLTGYSSSFSGIAHPTGSLLGGFDGLIVKFFDCPKLVLEQAVDTTFVAGDLVNFTISTLPNSSYQWQLDAGLGFQNLSNAGPYSGVNTPQLTISNTTANMNNYLFRCLVSYFGCSEFSDTVRLSLRSNTAVNSLTTFPINIYPNPSSNLVFIALDETVKAGKMRLFNTMGQLVYQQTFSGHQLQLGINTLNPGLYILEIKAGDKTSFSRLIKTSE